MPLILLLLVSILAASVIALVGKHELLVAHSGILSSKAFLSYVLLACGTLLPPAVYFYVFHGDWALSYIVSASQIPSAFAMCGGIALVILASLSFVGFAHWVRQRRSGWVWSSALVLVLLGAAAIVSSRQRLQWIGLTEGFERSFALTPLAESELFGPLLGYGALMFLGTFAVAMRLWFGRRMVEA